MDTRSLAAMRFRIRLMESVNLWFFAHGCGSKSDRRVEAFARCCPNHVICTHAGPSSTMVSVIDLPWVRNLCKSGLISFVADTVAELSSPVSSQHVIHCAPHVWLQSGCCGKVESVFCVCVCLSHIDGMVSVAIVGSV